MPKYNVQLELNGAPHNVVLEADAPPSEADIVSALKGSAFDPDRQAAKPEDFTPTARQDQTVGHTVGTALSDLNPLAGIRQMYNDWQSDTSMPEAVKNSPIGPLIPLAKNIARASYSEAKQVPQAFSDVVAGKPHAGWDLLSHVLGTIPIVGQMGVAARNAAEQGDTAGAIGHALAGGAGVLLDKLPEGISAGAEVAGNALQKTGRRIVSANLKVPEGLTRANPRIDIPTAVLEEGVNGLSSGIRKMDKKLGPDVGPGLNADATDALAADAAQKGKAYTVQPAIDALRQRIDELRHQVNAQPDIAATQQVLDNLTNNDVYFKDRLRGIVNPDGSLSWVKVGRDPRNVAAPELNLAKKTTQEGITLGKGYGNYGVEMGPTAEAEKTAAHALDSTLDSNVAGLDAINQARSKAIVVKKALKKTLNREDRKYGIGPMDLWAGAASGAAYPFLGPLAPVAGAAAVLLKHPTTAFPIAQQLFKAGRALPQAAEIAGPAAAVGAGANLAVRKVTKNEVDDRYAKVAALRASEDQ